MKSPELRQNDIENETKVLAFEELLNFFESNRDSNNGYIEYNLPYSKQEFLQYLTEKKGYLLHGSGVDFDTLEPQQANDAHKESGNKKAVYAVTDPVLPIFYAIKDRIKINDRVISGRTEEDGKVTYEFAMSKESLEQKPFKEGIVFILKKDNFTPEYDNGIPSNEWTSEKPVTPWGKLKVTPEDFQYMNTVTALE